MKKLIYLFSIVILSGIAISCSKSDDATPPPDPNPNPSGSTPGPKFLAVKSLLNSSCALSGCHVAPANSGGVNFESNTDIVANASQIKARAVDQGTMPPAGPLSAENKAKITDWISAGGKLTD